MSAKMKRRQRHDRRKRILTQRREYGQFFAHGTFPASAVAGASCTCGARAFSRGDDPDFHIDFYQEHAYCAESVAS